MVGVAEIREKGIGTGLQTTVISVLPNVTYRWEHPGASWECGAAAAEVSAATCMWRWAQR